MRYLGKRVRLNGQVPNNFSGEVVSSLKERQEGVRIKHSVNGNSVKLYDKALTAVGSVLRAETTIQNGSDFRVYRPKEADPNGPKAWRPMRRGIADIHRRADLSRKAAERYLEGFAAVDDDTTLEELISRLQTHTIWHGRRVRALRPFADDSTLLAAVTRGEFAISGFRNRDLQAIFFSSPALGLGQSQTATPSRTRPDLQNPRYAPLSTHPFRPQSHHRYRHRTSIHHPSTHSHGGMKSSRPEKNLCVSSTEITEGMRRKQSFKTTDCLSPHPLGVLCASVVNTRMP
jgi:hypothetical protein